jgi:hypothetical protein
MARYVVAALILAGLGSSAAAEVRPDDVALTRCQVDFDIAYELIAPDPASGETEEQAVAKLSPDTAAAARALRQWSRQASEKIAQATHLTAEDSSWLAVFEKAEEDDLLKRVDAVKTDDEYDAVLKDLLHKSRDCADRFQPKS